MALENDFCLQVLQEILSQPTAPYREERVAARVISYLREWGIPFTVDQDGTIIARYQRGITPLPLILMAHMDHPALTISTPGGPQGAEWTALLEGGVAPTYFDRLVSVRIFPRTATPNDEGIAAHVVAYTRDVNSRTLELHLTMDDPADATRVQPGDFGIWNLPDYDLRDGVVHARAVDDLVGCAEMLLTLQRAAKEEWETDLYAVFTRAEEVGLVGAFAVLQSGQLPRESLIVSLEASPLLPGVTQGGGPIIRAGDRMTTFSQNAEILLREAAFSLGATLRHASSPELPPEQLLQTQRHLMSGGGCEATAAVLLGYQATGLTIPLGNYHNMGPELTLAPEYILAQDFLTGVQVLQEAARLLPQLERIHTAYRNSFAPKPEQLARLRLPFVVERL